MDQTADLHQFDLVFDLHESQSGQLLVQINRRDPTVQLHVLVYIVLVYPTLRRRHVHINQAKQKGARSPQEIQRQLCSRRDNF